MDESRPDWVERLRPPDPASETGEWRTRRLMYPEEPRPDLFPPEAQERLNRIKGIAWHIQEFKTWSRALQRVHLDRVHQTVARFRLYRRHLSAHAEEWTP